MEVKGSQPEVLKGLTTKEREITDNDPWERAKPFKIKSQIKKKKEDKIYELKFERDTWDSAH